jgi:formylmethanofuran dehydrogenase subunit E
LKFLDYGKLAATFLNVKTGVPVRVVALDSSREAGNCAFPEIENKYERQRPREQIERGTPVAEIEAI